MPPIDLFELFATPIAVLDLPELAPLNEELAARLVAESRQTTGLQRSNAGGWHSTPDLGQRNKPCFRHVMQAIIDQICATTSLLAEAADVPSPRGYHAAAIAWAMVMRGGDYITPHDHGDAHWSSAYYVDAGDPPPEEQPDAGALAFLDPRRPGRPIPTLTLPSTFTVRPRTGALVIFPGSLQHFVHPYRGSRPRISISCNVSLDVAVGDRAADAR